MAERETISVSVCMATYNGARYVVEQLDSILAQLPHDGEVVVVDDASHDETVSLVRGIGDVRIRVIEQSENSGYVATFERAIAEARGDIVMLSDQDDVWVEGRVDALREALTRAEVVASDLALYPDGAPLPTPFGGKSWRLPSQPRQHRLRNTVGILAGAMPYFGCAMAFRRSAVSWVLPFPSFLVESHDLWIALCGNAARSMGHVQTVTVLRRLHDSNASPSRPRGAVSVLRSRWMLLRAVREASRRHRLRA